MRKAIFPGSFDPILGHEDIIKEVSFLTKLIAIESTPKKIYVFSRDRKRFIEETFKNEPKVTVIT
jgi:pantetheine-phosphate adenylyltransferase